MLRAAVERMPAEWHVKFERAAEDVRWAIGQADALEDRRNDIVHAPLHLVTPMKVFREGITKTEVIRGAHVEPHNWFLNYRARKLTGKELLSEFRWVRDTALTLRGYLDEIDANLRFEHGAWPRRPKMPTRREIRKRP
jgi:hypothetical protein